MILMMMMMMMMMMILPDHFLNGFIPTVYFLIGPYDNNNDDDHDDDNDDDDCVHSTVLCNSKFEFNIITQFNEL